jgi:glutathione gamma-glutamylcysteinyltransferase
MEETLYRRPLPPDAIAFSSREGRTLFAEALADGGLDGYFRLAEQFHTQSEPAFCGLGSLVVALNALEIDPGRLWKGPWRWFSEDLLDCCVPLAEVRERGLDVDELACLARCNGAEVQLQRADGVELASWREALASAASGTTVIVAAYDRAAMGQTGSGHFSPVGGYHRARDLALVLDVARFKYPPHWVAAERLLRAMQTVDPATSRARGWMALRRRERGIALGFSLSCEGENWHGLARRLTAVVSELGDATDLTALARAVLPLTAHVALRPPGAAAHRDALAAARTVLRNVAGYARIVEAVGSERAEAVTLLLLATADALTPAQRDRLGTSLAADDGALADELSNLRVQLAALSALAR